MSVVHSEISNNERSVAGRHQFDTAAATHSTVNARLLIAAVVIMACLSVAPTIPALVHQWSTVNDYDYCFLIALICVVWLWRAVHSQANLQLHPDRRFVTGLVLASGVAYLLWQGHSELGAQMLLPVIIWLAIASVTGWSVARVLLPPVAYFYFAIPLWDQLLPMLQQVTIFGAKSGMQLAGIPVTVNGNQVSIAEGTFEVIYGCSGLRYLVVALALATLVAVLERVPLRRFAIFLVLTVLLAVLANWLRIFIIMYAGHVTGMRHYFVTDNHKGLGHLVFAGLLAVIYWMASRFRQGATAPNPIDAQGSTLLTTRLPAHVAVVVVVLSVFTILTARATWFTQANYAMPALRSLPVMAGQWQGPLPRTSVWQPAFEGASDVQQATYESAKGRVEVYLNTYGVQRQGAELVFYRNTVYAPGKWQLVDAGLSNAFQASRGVTPLITEQLTGGGERWIIGQLYVVGGHRTATGVFAQMLYGLSTVTRPDPAGMLAMAVNCAADDCVAANTLLMEFWQQMGDALVATIPEALPTVIHGS